MPAAPNLLDGLLAWWKLDDFAGGGSVLRDSGPFGHHGHYISTAGINQSRPAFVPAFDLLEVDGGCAHANVFNPDACSVTDCVLVPSCHGDGSYQQHGWTRSGRAGAATDDFGFYDPASFTFVIFCASSANDDTCPGILTDFAATPGFAGGTFTYYGFDSDIGVEVGDRVWFQRIFDTRPRMWKAIGPVSVPYDEAGVFSFTVGDTAADFEDGIWELDEWWMGCYDDPGQNGYGPYYTFGLAGDHSGFPFNSGWTMFTKFEPKDNPPNVIHGPAYTVAADMYGECFPLSLWLFSESNGAHPPLLIPMGRIHDGKWNMFAITSDGTTVRTYRNCAQVSYGPANRLTASNAGMGFGFADRNLALSGKDELWQGDISNALMWDHPLTRAELCHLFSNWCEPRHSIRTHHRAEPGTADPGGVETKLHLSNTRLRAEPDATPPSAGSGFAGPHLDDVRFRAE